LSSGPASTVVNRSALLLRLHTFYKLLRPVKKRINYNKDRFRFWLFSAVVK
jgi:hypothetical protein